MFLLSTHFVLVMLTFNMFNVEMKIGTIGERIRIARNQARLTQEQLALALGLSGQSAVGNYERDVNVPDVATLTKIAEITGVSLMWLISGGGEHSDLVAENIVTRYSVSEDKYAFIPRYSASAAAGGGLENGHEEVSGTHAYRRDWLERRQLLPALLAVIEVEGDSMSPTINDGDVILVNRAERKIRKGQVFVFQTEAGVRLKRLYKLMDGRVRVSSDILDKIAYPDKWLTPGMDATVIGMVVHRSGSVQHAISSGVSSTICNGSLLGTKPAF